MSFVTYLCETYLCDIMEGMRKIVFRSKLTKIRKKWRNSTALHKLILFHKQILRYIKKITTFSNFQSNNFKLQYQIDNYFNKNWISKYTQLFLVYFFTIVQLSSLSLVKILDSMVFCCQLEFLLKWIATVSNFSIPISITTTYNCSNVFWMS